MSTAQATQTSADMSASQLASEVSARIATLEALFESPLENEIDALKTALLENPAAASLLSDQDVGLLVKNLRRTISAAAVASATGATEKKVKETKKKMTPEELEAALAAEGF